MITLEPLLELLELPRYITIGVPIIIALAVVSFLFRKQIVLLYGIFRKQIKDLYVSNPIVVVSIATGVLLCVIGLARVFFIDASIEEALKVEVGGKSEAYICLQRAISDPFLIIGVIGMIVGVVLAFVNPKQLQDRSHDSPQKPKE